MIDIEFIKQHLNYNSDNGVFTWIKGVSKYSRVIIGSEAGYSDAYGYIVIGFMQKDYKAHRLAYLFVTGEMPDGFIDHKNGDKKDNRFENLRVATQFENMQNAKIKKSNTTGFMGVCFNKREKKYVSHIRVKGKKKYLGCFDNPEDAFSAYLIEKNKSHSYMIDESLMVRNVARLV